MRWIDVCPDVVEEPELPFPRLFLECETLKGDNVVLPSQHLKIVSDPLQIAIIRTKVPRAVVDEDYERQRKQELTVSVSPKWNTELLSSSGKH